MDILKIAAESGMQIVLDGRIGREEYRSVVGTLQALHRFADALCEVVRNDTLAINTRANASEMIQSDSVEPIKDVVKPVRLF